MPAAKRAPKTRSRTASATATAGVLPLSPSALGAIGDDELEDAQEQKLSVVVNNFAAQSDMGVRVWRVVDRQPQYLEKFPLSADLLDDVAKVWGGGEYRCRVVDGQNRFPKGGSFTFRVAGDSLTGARVSAAPAKGGSDLADVQRLGLMEMFQSAQRNNTATLEFIKAQSAPKGDTLDTILKLGALATPLIMKWWDSREKPISRDELQELMKSAGRRADGPARGLGDIVEQLKGLDEVRELLGGGDGNGNGGSVAMGMFEKLAPLVSRVLDRIPAVNGAGNGAPSGEPIAEIAAPDNGFSGAGAPGANGDDAMPANGPAWVEQLRAFEGHIYNTAASGEDPRDFAQSLKFWIPPGMKGQLREVLSGDDATAEILQNFPRLGMYPEWVADFVDELTEMFVGPIADDDEQPA